MRAQPLILVFGRVILPVMVILLVSCSSTATFKALTSTRTVHCQCVFPLFIPLLNPFTHQTKEIIAQFQMEHPKIPLNFTPTDDLAARRDARKLVPRNEVSNIPFSSSDVQNRNTS
jgi:hypothetical protein